jgi:hypothetical protein
MKDKNNNELSPKLMYATKLALVVLVLSVTGLFLYFFQPTWFKFDFSSKKDDLVTVLQTENTTSTPVCDNCVRRLLDGEMVKPELEKLRPYAVMMDNFPAARPQSGLSRASIVYEAPAEGGITRYLAVFSPDKAPSEIGPVRSARSYFLAWAKELNATYVHVGGSPEALELAKKIGSSDLNEFFKGSYFWRSDIRLAPHNVLISGDNLNKYRSESNESGNNLTSWQFKDTATSTTQNSNQIKIKYPKDYDVTWHYQPSTNEYERSQSGVSSFDVDGSKIIAKNIVIHLTSFKVVDDKLRLEISTALSGAALLCQDGVCSQGNWKKNSTSGRAKYYYKTGEEFVFNTGTTWIEVIEDLSKLEY